MFRQLRTCVVVAFAIMCACILAIWVIDRDKIAEVGGTTLEVEFVVVDEASGQPIADATVQVHSEGGWYEGGDKVEDFALISDASGSARQQCLNNIWIGGSSTLHLRDYRHVRIPHWWVTQVRAIGYETSESNDLAENYGGKTQHVGPGKDRLVVRVPLKKAKDNRE